MVDDSFFFAMPELTGSRIRLEPLRYEHAVGYLAAAGSEEDAAEIFQWQSPPGGALARPVTVEDARAHVVAALAARARGVRLPYAQIDVATGRFAGTTSFADPDPRLRTLAIGHTWLGRQWWGTGANAEAKLLMLSFAFESLAVVRVMLVTDVRNERARAAIERLGATREGTMRKHRRRADGTWRDTLIYAITDDDWPRVKDHLAGRLRPHPQTTAPIAK
ncbi:GNAT family N-acetyltransferase [Plantactinospora endophytica]|nr:GNAT family protein [Plantactinospora endophytica]